MPNTDPFRWMAAKTISTAVTTTTIKLLLLQVVKVNLNQPMDKIREILGGYSVRTRLSLTGTMVVARDIAHAKLQERIESGQGLPDYVKDHIIYYAGEREGRGVLMRVREGGGIREGEREREPGKQMEG